MSHRIYICDIDNVIRLLEILNERLLSHVELFEPVLFSVLDVCSKVV